MKRSLAAILANLAVSLSLAPVVEPLAQESSKVSAIYGGGAFYSGGIPVMDDLRASGFTTVILWTIHVGPQGNMNFNNVPVIDTNGEYIGDPSWGSRVMTLRQAPTNVDRIEIGVASAGVNDFRNIGNLIAAQGTGPDSVLYKGFDNLRTITGADAINIDDETEFNVSTMVQFSIMLADLGYKVAFVPYNNRGFWETVYQRIEQQRVGTVDRVYLQVYAGGAGNVPSEWNGGFGDLKVIPGLWAVHGGSCNIGDNPEQVQARMQGWSTDISGGFIWLYDDVEKCSAPGRRTADYAAAINSLASARNNISGSATITVSSEFADPRYAKEGLTDGIVGRDANGEWASGGEQTPFAELSWTEPVTIDEVALYDRPNPIEHIKDGSLTFSDGSVVNVGELPNNGAKAAIAFSERTVDSVRFRVTNAVGPNVGLSEFQVFGERQTSQSPPAPPPTTPPVAPPGNSGGGGGLLDCFLLIGMLFGSLTRTLPGSPPRFAFWLRRGQRSVDTRFMIDGARIVE